MFCLEQLIKKHTECLRSLLNLVSPIFLNYPFTIGRVTSLFRPRFFKKILRSGVRKNSIFFFKIFPNNENGMFIYLRFSKNPELSTVNLSFLATHYHTNVSKFKFSCHPWLLLPGFWGYFSKWYLVSKNNLLLTFKVPIRSWIFANQSTGYRISVNFFEL